MSEIITYEVVVSATQQSSLSAFLTWLEEEHMEDVVAAGALSAAVYESVEGPLELRAHYLFANLEAFRTYEKEKAPGLRTKSKAFLADHEGIEFRRSLLRQVGALPNSKA